MSKFTDLHVARDDDGIYDLVIENGDFKKTAGMDSAVLVSFFTDRRANPDEVADPAKRRGWCGTQNTPDQQGNAGSGLWMYEQRRLDKITLECLRMEGYQCLAWLITDRLAKQIEVTTDPTPEARSTKLNAKITALNGGVTNIGFQIWGATPRRTLKK